MSRRINRAELHPRQVLISGLLCLFLSLSLRLAARSGALSAVEFALFFNGL